MLDTDPTDPADLTPSGPQAADSDDAAPARERPARKRAPRKSTAAAGPPAIGDPAAGDPAAGDVPAAAATRTPRKRAARKAVAPAGPPPIDTDAGGAQPTPDQPGTPGTPDQLGTPDVPPAKKTARKRAAKKIAVSGTGEASITGGPEAEGGPDGATVDSPSNSEPAAEAPAKKSTRKRAPKKTAAETTAPVASEETGAEPAPTADAAMATPGVLFLAPPTDPVPAKKSTKKAAKKAAKKSGKKAAEVAEAGDEQPLPTPVDDAPAADAIEGVDDGESEADPDDVREAAIEQASGARRRRRRGRRGRGGARADGDDGDDAGDDPAQSGEQAQGDGSGDQGDDKPAGEGTSSTARRRRRRRSGSADADADGGDPPNTVTHVRDGGKKDDGDDGVRGVKGSTRLEAKRQRRRDGRDTSRRRAPILTEAEFLARREAVDRVMAVRQNGDRTQIAVLEDDILVEHYVTRASATSYVGNVYLGRVQNVLPSMEAAFVDIGKGRNGVLYAGEVNWDAAGLEGKSRAIENAMKSGDTVLVQVTKDPIGHKGARLTSQISLPGRFLVLVPGGGMTGISRRLPDTERHRLKSILKKIVPEDAGVIVRTAAEGASEEDLTRDVERLAAQWAQIDEAAEQTKSSGPKLVHGEPDLAIRVVRDVFNEDFKSLVVQGDDAWQTVSDYLGGVAPDLAERASRHTGNGDLFHELRVDEQLMKALDRKVWLPSGGSLVIDRTEAMTVIDVNTGKFVGSGGNLEQTVTRNNIEAAEEIVRQLRLRDVGGIVVVDFIDMVLESNRELVLRRLTECLGRDRTKHQVAEVTSLGLVQMTRKRVGEGLLEAFSEPCPHCNGRGVLVHSEPVDKPAGNSASDDANSTDDGGRGKGRRRRGGRGNGSTPVEPVEALPEASDEQRKAASAAIAAIHRATSAEVDDSGAAGGSRLDTLASDLVHVAAGLNDATAEPAAEPSAAPAPESDSAGAEAASAGPDEAEQLAAAAVESVAHVEAGAAPAPTAGRRRRRAASRPAGPPGGS